MAQSEPLPQIRVAVWSGPEADNLRKVVEAYTAETGNPVEIDEIARDGYDAALRTSIVGGGSDWDVVYASADWLPAFIAADGLAPIDEYIAGMPADFLNVADLEPGVSNLTFDGKVYGFPSEGDTAWLFYRTDLLEAAGIEPPQTMDEMLARHRRSTRPTATAWSSARGPMRPGGTSCTTSGPSAVSSSTPRPWRSPSTTRPAWPR